MTMLGLTPQSGGVQELVHKSIVGTDEIRYAATVSSLRLNNKQAGEEKRPSVLFENIIYDCNIGLRFWESSVVTFDVPHQQIIVARP